MEKRLRLATWVALGVMASLAGSTAPTGAQLLRASQSVETDRLVGPDEQRARDGERERILLDEVAREQAAATEAAQRHAERLAVADARGADAAEEARLRALENLSALSRELDALHERSMGAAPSIRATGAGAHAWWDVYQKPEHALAPMRPTQVQSTARISVVPAPTAETSPTAERYPHAD